MAFATHLLAARMLSLKRTAQTLKALTGRAVAQHETAFITTELAFAMGH